VCIEKGVLISFNYLSVCADMEAQLMNLDAEEEWQDDEKTRCVNKMVDLCLSLTEEVIRLKDLIESSTMKRRIAAALPPLPQYSYCSALVEPFIRDIRQRQQQEEEQRMDADDEDSNCSSCEDMIDCDDDSRRVVCVDSIQSPLKRQKLM